MIIFNKENFFNNSLKIYILQILKTSLLCIQNNNFLYIFCAIPKNFQKKLEINL